MSRMRAWGMKTALRPKLCVWVCLCVCARAPCVCVCGLRGEGDISVAEAAPEAPHIQPCHNARERT